MWEKKQILIKWILQTKYVVVGGISVEIVKGGSRAGSWMMNWTRMRGGRKADGRKDTGKCGTFVFQQLYPHVVLKWTCPFFRVVTITPLHRSRNGDSVSLKNMPEMTLMTERNGIQPPKALPLSSSLSRSKVYLGMAIWHIKAWITKPNSVSIIIGRCLGEVRRRSYWRQIMDNM